MRQALEVSFSLGLDFEDLSIVPSCDYSYMFTIDKKFNGPLMLTS